MEGVQLEGRKTGPRYPGRLWRGFAGTVRLSGLSEWCIVDRCPACDRDLSFRTRDGGGTRTYGLRPRVPAKHLREAQAAFFTSLRGSIANDGVKLPVLLWGINGKLYVRYGASRVYVAGELGLERIPAVLCSFGPDGDEYEGFLPLSELETPQDVLRIGFQSPQVVGEFEVSHERIDAHRLEP
jgi:hypothetical protein